MNMTMTKHATVRQQQRRIPPLILDWLCQYGATRKDGLGAELRFFDKRSRKDLARVVGEDVVRRLSGLLDTYAVVSDGGTVITAGHRYKAIREYR